MVRLIIMVGGKSYGSNFTRQRRNEESMVMEFLPHKQLPLDHCLYALRASIPHLIRSTLHRRLRSRPSFKDSAWPYAIRVCRTRLGRRPNSITTRHRRENVAAFAPKACAMIETPEASDALVLQTDKFPTRWLVCKAATSRKALIVV